VQVAVTFCNQHSSPRLAVCAVDLRTDERAWLPVPDAFDRGAAGITQIDTDLLVGCQPGGIVRYDRDLEVAGFLPTPEARNLHSILYRADERALYVTSAHDDSLHRYRLGDGGRTVIDHEVVFCADPRRRGQDRYHLNSLVEWRGDLYVSMFGPSDGPTHRHRRNGQVVRVADGAVILEGLYHPHSLHANGEELLVIESQAHTVRRVLGGPDARWHVPGGYPRGIVTAPDYRIWVGTSSLRRESSSLGTPNVIDSSSPLDFTTRLVELDLSTGEVGRTVDLTPLASEIFDVRALPAGVSFEPSPDAGLSERIAGLVESFRVERARNRLLEKELERSPARRLREFSARARRRFTAARAARSGR